MECKDVRKKLKEFAENRIYDPMELNAMENHIDGCMICKKELSMWQDVISQQKKVQSLNASGSFADRIRKRNKASMKGSNLPPMARRVLAAQQMFSSGMGCLILEVILLVAFVAFIYFFTDKLSSPIVVIMTSIGGLTMIILLIREMIKGKKK